MCSAQSLGILDFSPLILLFVCFLYPISAIASPHEVAQNLLIESVEAAINAVDDGGTVILPAGTITWTRPLIVGKSLTLQGISKAAAQDGNGYSDNGTPSLVSDDSWATIIQDGLPPPSTAAPNPPKSLIVFNTVAGKNYRLSQVKIQRDPLTSHSTFDPGVVSFTGMSGSVRLDHCFFNDPDNRHVGISGGVMGVADHNWFKYSGNNHPFLVRNGDFNGGVNGNHAWESPAARGNSRAWYIEDCYFTDDGSTYVGIADSWRGGAYVLRNCSGTTAQFHFSNHGTESSQNERSGRLIEAYRNNFVSTSSHGRIVEYRGGSGVQWNNSYTMNGQSSMALTTYRVDGSVDPWWFGADGTIAWDAADHSDLSDSPGGAGDGVFESGTSTDGGLKFLTDSTKNWGPTNNKWVGYVVRALYTFTATGSAVGTVTASGAHWTPGQFAGYVFTDKTNNAKGIVSSNTSDTITLSTSYFVPDTSSTSEFELSMSGRIVSNTPTSLTIAARHDSSPTFPQVVHYEIRRLLFCLDQPGAGPSQPYNPKSKPPHQTLGQGHDEPLYAWGNKLNGTQFNLGNSGYVNIQEDRDYFNFKGSFDGSSGIGIGTLAQMNAIQPSKNGVGFWATDSGEWDSSNGSAPDGQLYVWRSGSWSLSYTPFSYPHPLALPGSEVAIGRPAPPSSLGINKE